MNNDKKYEKMGLSYDKAMAYIANRFSGKSAKSIGQTMGKGERTIQRYIKDFDDYVQQSDEYQQAIRDIVFMIPDAVGVYKDALQTRGGQGNPDIAVANNVFKIAAILKERTKIETGDSNNSDSDLFGEFWGLISASAGDGSISEHDNCGEKQGVNDSQGAETKAN